MRKFLEERMNGHRHELALAMARASELRKAADDADRQVLLRQGHVDEAAACLAELERAEQAKMLARLMPRQRDDAIEQAAETPPAEVAQKILDRDTAERGRRGGEAVEPAEKPAAA